MRKDGKTGHFLAILSANLPQARDLRAPFGHLRIGQDGPHGGKLSEVEAEVLTDLPERFHVKTGHNLDHLCLILEDNLL